MVKFTWEYTSYKKTGKTYIRWKATWDGRWDNDPLFSAEEKWNDFSHPFVNTIDYQQSRDMFEYFSKMSPEQKKKDIMVNVLQDDGSTKEESLGIVGDVEPEDYNPEKLMKCGDTVAVNTVTKALCELLSEPEKIATVSGNVHAACYRSKLLGCLSLLWD